LTLKNITHQGQFDYVGVLICIIRFPNLYSQNFTKRGGLGMWIQF